ncbi:type II toxin-antitoxin system HipA family toxin [Myxococcota bacterium]|nr:type II toxin-antitoxin system HipA family toxin [Myxococcota bacterium]
MAFVYVHEVLVGHLEFLGFDANASSGYDHLFVFDGAWLKDGQRPILGQQFEDSRPRPIRASGVPNWFAHILPTRTVRRIVAGSVVLDDESSDLDLLVAIGNDLPGAVTVQRAMSVDGGMVAARRPEVPPGTFAFGLHGMQMKVSYRRDAGAFVCPVYGEAGDFIAKFEDSKFDRMPEVEHATTLWARRSGVETHRVRISSIRDEGIVLPEGVKPRNGVVLLAERFDRSDGGGRVHVEDFGQIIGCSLDYELGLGYGSYEEMARLVARLCPEDVTQWIRRLIFMLVCGNADAHWKNWGVIYADRRHPRLSPAYDLVSCVVFGDDEMALTLGGSRRFEDAKPARWDKLARALEMSHAELARLAREARERAEAVWSQERGALGFDAREVAMIERHLQRLPSWV